MERYFIPVRAEYPLERLNIAVLEKKMPKRIGLLGSVQYLDAIEKVKPFLEEKGFIVEIGGQILGCNVALAKPLLDKVDAYLYIGDGLFHPKALEKLQKDVFLEDGRKLKYKQLKVNMVKLLHGENIGIVVSLKPGQLYPQYEKLKKALEDKFPDKRFYLFICDAFDHEQMKNFGFIDCWINTACPRIQDDIPVVNVEDLHEIIDPKLSAASVHSDEI